MITVHHTSPTSRRAAILEAATRAFSMFGLRGTSLRDIAKEAGVSLTLLDHHFGNKAALLEAVVSSHSTSCLQKIAPLQASLMVIDGALTLERLVDEWVDYEFGISDSRQSRHDLHLVLRLAADLEVDPALRNGINCSESVIMEALRRIAPRLDEAALRSAWVLASSALYAAILGMDETDAAGLTPDSLDIRAETKAFLIGGLGCLSQHAFQTS